MLRGPGRSAFLGALHPKLSSKFIEVIHHLTSKALLENGGAAETVFASLLIKPTKQELAEAENVNIPANKNELLIL